MFFYHQVTVKDVQLWFCGLKAFVMITLSITSLQWLNKLMVCLGIVQRVHYLEVG